MDLREGDRVGADTEESGMPEREQPRIAHHDIEAVRGDDVDAKQTREIDPVARNEKRKRNQHRRKQGGPAIRRA